MTSISGTANASASASANRMNSASGMTTSNAPSNVSATANATVNANDIRMAINKYDFNTQILHLSTIKSPTKSAFIGSKGNSYHALEKCEGVNAKVKPKTNEKEKEKKFTCCPCYNNTSLDARCCGACYYCCPLKNKEDQCEFCPNTFTTYWKSGYIQTNSGYGKEEENGCCCWVCFPVKFPLFFPCFLGSICNSCINEIRHTNLNYLF